MRRIAIHPETPLFPLACALAETTPHLRIVVDGERSYIVAAGEIPATAVPVYALRRRPTAAERLDRQALISQLSAHDALAAHLIKADPQ